MSVQIAERSGALVVEVMETFHPDDANLIEAAVERLPPGPVVEVDLRRAREKHMLALWLLAQAARREPGRYRVTGPRSLNWKMRGRTSPWAVHSQ